MDLVAEFGGPTAFALLVGTPKTHVSAILSGKRGVGDKLAAKIEAKCGKPPGWMDEDRHGEAPQVDAELVEGLADLRRINPETYDKLAREIAAIVEGARASDRIIRAKTTAEYVTPERARETLSREIHETAKARRTHHSDSGLSVDEVLQRIAAAQALLQRYNLEIQGKVVKELPPGLEALLNTPSGFGSLPEESTPPKTAKK